MRAKGCFGLFRVLFKLLFESLSVFLRWCGFHSLGAACRRRAGILGCSAACIPNACVVRIVSVANIDQRRGAWGCLYTRTLARRQTALGRGRSCRGRVCRGPLGRGRGCRGPLGRERGSWRGVSLVGLRVESVIAWLQIVLGSDATYLSRNVSGPLHWAWGQKGLFFGSKRGLFCVRY